MSRVVCLVCFALLIQTACGDVFPILAGQHHNIGNLSVVLGNNQDICVTYEIAGEWTLVEWHMWIGQEASTWPETRHGNPKIGQFPYGTHKGDATTATHATMCVELTDIYHVSPLQCTLGSSIPDVVVAAHAVVRNEDTQNTETAWSVGDTITSPRGKGSWAMQTHIETTCSCSCAPQTICFEADAMQCTWPSDRETHVLCKDSITGCGRDETAFAQGAQSACFLDGITGYSFVASRWGWTSQLSRDAVTTMPIFAGAGRCDTIGAGKEIGVATFAPAATSVSVAITLHQNADTRIDVESVHLYVGEEPWPRDSLHEYTVAPGQYPVKHESLIRTDFWDFATCPDNPPEHKSYHLEAPVATSSGPLHAILHLATSGYC